MHQHQRRTIPALTLRALFVCLSYNCGMPKANTPKELLLVGGPNGAGKTTFATEYVAQKGCTYLGADAIAYEMAPDDVASVAVAAGREFIYRLDALLKAGETAIVESTLAGKSLAKWLERAKAEGYEVTVIYVMIDSAEKSLQRVKERVNQGGHDVPEADVIRRFERTARNFWHTYREIADLWDIYYNQDEQRLLVATGDRDTWIVHEEQRFEKFLQIAGE